MARLDGSATPPSRERPERESDRIGKADETARLAIK
jgi:hypothetical protein